MNRFTRGAAALALLAATTASAFAQAKYPEKALTFVVPFAAGSATDQLARALGNAVTDQTKQPVVVDNKGGASGMLAGRPVRAGGWRRGALDLRLLGLGYVPQERNVFPNLGVRENLETAYKVAGDKAAAIDIQERIAFVESLFPRLAERRAQHAGLMSGGEQRMVALGMGLMLKPRVLLLDEPTTGLAPVIVHELMKTIRRLRETDGISILIIEQNIASLLRVVDRLYIMREGTCAQFEGEPEDLGRQNIWEYL